MCNTLHLFLLYPILLIIHLEIYRSHSTYSSLDFTMMLGPSTLTSVFFITEPKAGENSQQYPLSGDQSECVAVLV